jgi:sterol desaturase/sphingolipid hydroxylase (fatty acid hydroxylase superfamily)
VDLLQPLFAQIDELGDRYFDWVHEPVNAGILKRLPADHKGRWPRSVRIFHTEWLEVQTHIPFKLILGLWVPIVLALLALSTVVLGMAPLAILGLFAAGFFFWTMAEYILHRVVFHAEPDTPLGRKFHFLAHGIHHLDPQDPTRLLFPPLAGGGIALILFGILNIFLPFAESLPAMAGLLSGYLAYDVSHYLSHHGKTRGGWHRFLRRYHLAHHFQDPDSRFGVSQPLWDIILRSGSLKV